MTATRKKLNPGQAVVQFLALKSVIVEMRMQGHSHSAIYRTLRESGKITMSYEAFIYNVKRHVYQQTDSGSVTEHRARERKKPPATPAGQATLPAVTEHNNAPAVAAVAAEEKKSFGQDPPKEYTDII